MSSIYYDQAYREFLRLNDMTELPSDDVDGPPLDQFDPSWEVAR